MNEQDTTTGITSWLPDVNDVPLGDLCAAAGTALVSALAGIVERVELAMATVAGSQGS